ncbi:MAG: shikimate kinase [Lactococcus sp.]
MTLVLIGFMGAGKSTVARLLTADYQDLDKVITDKIGMPIATYFEQFGEQKFRQIEQESLLDCLDNTNTAVIATGGGIVESAENLKILANENEVVYLKADFECLFERIRSDKLNVRPLAQQGQQLLLERYESRKNKYEAVADLILDVRQNTPEVLARKIKDWQEPKKRLKER